MIPIEFAAFESELDDVPTPDRYGLWDAAALATLLEKTRRYRNLVQESCRALLDDLERRHPDDV